MTSLQVVAGIIKNQNGEILIALRPEGKHLAGHWEFPGGKVELEESEESALTRELHEELNLKISILSKLGVFPFSYEWGNLDLHVFIVTALNTPTTTHDIQEFKWINPVQIDHATLAPADIQPLKIYLMHEYQTKVR